MSEAGPERRLAAILVADVVGYSRLIGRDETATLSTFGRHREELIEPTAIRHNGIIVNTGINFHQIPRVKVHHLSVAEGCP